MFKEKKIKDFCEENGLSLLIIFGSYVSSETHKGSDIDIAVLEGNKKINKLELICKLERIFETSVDLTIITSHTNPLLGFEIFSKGKALYEKKDGLFEEWRLKAWKKYLDTDKIRRLEEEFIKNYIRSLKNVS